MWRGGRHDIINEVERFSYRSVVLPFVSVDMSPCCADIFSLPA